MQYEYQEKFPDKNHGVNPEICKYMSSRIQKISKKIAMAEIRNYKNVMQLGNNRNLEK